jgi:DNA-binding transcriptional MerR regulator
VWRDPRLGEVADHRAEGLVLVRQFEHGARLRTLTFTLTVSQTSPMVAKTEARTWRVGELADELGVTTRTLRFYESEGLITPERQGSARIYSARDRTRLMLILRGKRFGMSLTEIAEIVDMYDGVASSERRQLDTLLARLEVIAGELRQRQTDLQATLTEVTDVAAQCRARLEQLSTD